MTAERRQNFRLLMTLECAMNVANQGFRRCRTRDISQDGVFVVGKTEGLAPNDQVTLAVQTTKEGRTQVRHFSALVRHVTPSGVGLYIKDAHVLLEAVLAVRSPGIRMNAIMH